MSLDKVVEDILRRGDEKKQEIIRKGERERDALLEQAKSDIERSREGMEKQFESTIVQMEQQELSSAELESKRLLLEAQRRVMEELKHHVLSELSRYPNDKRKTMYSTLASKAVRELGECLVYCNRSDRELIAGTKGVEFAGSIDCIGGLVFETKDRSVRLDFRFESLLEDVWSRKVQEIYNKLFG